MKYWVRVYGCQMNEKDAEDIGGLLEEAGYKKAPDLESSDVVVVVTCCVRETAERKAYGFIDELKRLKANRPGMVIAVGGCMTQQPGVPRFLMGRSRHVDVVFGTHNLHRIVELVERARESGERVIEVLEQPEAVRRFPSVSRRETPFKAFVNIAFGCDNFCSYCIVPYVRGPMRSRPPEDIVREVETLARGGVKEVTLLGQNVNAYGRDLQDGAGFAGLLRRLDEVDGIERIRYTTSHPRDFDDGLIEVIAASKKVCEHFHLPVQAGSDKVLELMNRGYTREGYLSLLQRIRSSIPHASITTDLIVGFPGESEADFRETVDLVRRARFDQAFTFMFSPRKGTPAAEMPAQVPLEERRARLRELMSVQYPISLEKNRELEGKEVEVLVEGLSKTNPAYLTGRTRTNKVVHFEGGPELAGGLYLVRVLEARTWTLLGRFIPAQPDPREARPDGPWSIHTAITGSEDCRRI